MQHLAGDERSRLRQQNAVEDVADESDPTERMLLRKIVICRRIVCRCSITPGDTALTPNPMVCLLDRQRPVGATSPPSVSAVSAASTRNGRRAARSDLAPERTRRSAAILPSG
jgi:hypothetical protein